MIFQMPLILTSSVMCILNSFDDGSGNMKIPNVVVNGISVLLVSYQSNLKVHERLNYSNPLSNQFLQLAHQIEGLEMSEIDKNMVNNMVEKYDGLVTSCLFEDIPNRYKLKLKKLMHGKALPLQLKCVWNNDFKDEVISGEIV